MIGQNSKRVAIQRLLSSLLLIAIVSSCSSFGQGSNALIEGSLQEAEEAFSRTEHEKAYGIFNHVWSDESQSLADRTTAGHYLVKINWRLYKKVDMAYKLLNQLEELNNELSNTYTLRARLLASEQKFTEAIDWSERAMQASESETEKYDARSAYVIHSFSRLKQAVLKGSKLPVLENAELERAYGILQTLERENPGDLTIAKLYMGYALHFYNGLEAFRSWKLFFKIRGDEMVHPSLMENPEVFQAALSNYQANSDNQQDVTIIIKGLAESGFFEYATMLKTKEFGKSEQKDARLNEIVVYNDFLKRLDKVTTNFYEETIAGNTAIYDYNAQFKEECEKLWVNLDWKGHIPKFSQDGFDQTIRQRFKTLYKLMSVNGYYGLLMGHVILDDKRVISQYDQRAEFRFNSVDHMVSNGYTTWFSDGENQVGGWATGDGSFLMVRSGLNGQVTMLWSILTDPTQMKKMQTDIDRFALLEDEQAGKNPYVFLPGLKFRMLINESKELVDSLKTTGLEGKSLRFEFINLMERIAQDSKIYAHEGRHSIDMKYGFSKTSKQLEYTAKLSEIYFSAKPIFFLASIIDANLGDGTSHGDANLMLVKGLVGWMNQHQSEIAGFDPSKPTQPQMDKLTDQQLKKAVKSLDPMAN